MKKPLFVHSTEIRNESREPVAAEIELNKKKIVDDKPLPVAIAILQYSKLLFCEFIQFLNSHVEPDTCKTLYCDTDSICLALTKRVNETDSVKNYFNIKPAMLNSWQKNYSKWFVHEDTVECMRQPGLLKTEFLLNDGHFICLAPKSYLAVKRDGKRKLATKGLSHYHNIKLEVRKN